MNTGFGQLGIWPPVFIQTGTVTSPAAAGGRQAQPIVTSTSAFSVFSLFLPYSVRNAVDVPMGHGVLNARNVRATSIRMSE